MKDLRPPFDRLGAEILETFVHIHRQRGKEYDLYAVAYGVELLLRKYDVKLRPEPLERSEILKPPPVCAVCSRAIGDRVITGARLHPDEDRLVMHPECVAERKP